MTIILESPLQRAKTRSCRRVSQSMLLALEDIYIHRIDFRQFIANHTTANMAPNSRIILTRHAQAEHNVDLDYTSQ
jgi:hypothetical protein